MFRASSSIALSGQGTTQLRRFAAGLPLELRAETEDDETFLVELYRSSRHDEIRRAGLDPVMMQGFLDRQFVLQRRHYVAHYDRAGFFVIEQAGTRIGRIYIHAGPGDYRLVDINLLPDYRGAGLGTQLIRALQAFASARDCKVSLHVDPMNRAGGLYLRLGFVIVDQSQASWRLEWHRGG
jgi:ribosomal protein S18 acetylase RimI-like enzyme